MLFYDRRRCDILVLFCAWDANRDRT